MNTDIVLNNRQVIGENVDLIRNKNIRVDLLCCEMDSISVIKVII